jgi:ubiquinone/menaquinone biosynthesis C-methylase UbiE
MPNPWLKKDVSWSWPKEANANGIIKELNIQKKDKVLDIGCGNGAHLRDIRKKTGANCFGADIRKDIFKQNKNRDVKLRYSDIRNLKFSNNSFNKIYSIGTFEHVPQTGKVFSEVSRILKKDGKVLFTVPNECSFFHLTKKLKQFLGIWKLGYEESFTIKELNKILKKHNFIIEKSYIVGHPKVFNIFNWMDNQLNKLNNKRFGFFIRILASKAEK